MTADNPWMAEWADVEALISISVLLLGSNVSELLMVSVPMAAFPGASTAPAATTTGLLITPVPPSVPV